MRKLKIKCHSFWVSNQTASVPVACIYWILLLGHLIHIKQWLIVGTHIVAHMVHTNYFLNQKLCLKVVIIVKKTKLCVLFCVINTALKKGKCHHTKQISYRWWKKIRNKWKNQLIYWNLFYTLHIKREREREREREI